MAAETIVPGRVGAGDIEIAYVLVGEGAPVVAIHGGPGLGHGYLRPGFDLLANGRQIVYYDMRGSGDSPAGDPDRISVAGSLADLDCVLDGLGFERASLAGHSTGGYVAMLYAASRPERVRALVMASPGPPLVPELRERFGQAMASRRPSEDAEAMKQIEDSEEFARRDVETLERYFRLRYGPFFTTRAQAQSLSFGFTEITAGNVIEASGRLLRDFADHDPVGSLRGLSCPTLVVHGDNDPIPVESSQFIAKQIPQGRLAVIEGGSHFEFVENPARFAATVEPFLAENDATRGGRESRSG